MTSQRFPEFTELIHSDGSILEFDEEDRFIVSTEGEGLPEIEYVTQQGFGQHGATWIDYKLKPRIIQIVMRQNSCNRYDYWLRRGNLLNKVRPNRSGTTGPFGPVETYTLRKRLPNGNIRDIDVMPLQGPVFSAQSKDVYDEYGFTETLRFIAHNPIYYDPAIKYAPSFTVDPPKTELVFPITFPIEFCLDTFKDQSIKYNGTWKGKFIIWIWGPCNGFKLTHLGTNETFTLNYFIEDWDYVVLDLYAGTAINSNGDSILSCITEPSDFSTIGLYPEGTFAAGGYNSLRLEAMNFKLGLGHYISYYEHYIGI